MELSGVNKIIVCLLMMITDLATVKISYSKSASFCGMKGFITSGIISNGNYSDVEQIDKRCNGPAYLIIDLRDKFEVHYVVVYEGKAGGGKNVGQLDYFKLKVGHETSSRCSEYPYTSRGPNKGGMRVNCEFLDKIHGVKSVALHSRINRGFYLSEVEIHNLGSDKPLTELLLYHGCFKHFTGLQYFIRPSLSRCQRKCISEKYSLAAISRGSLCHCGNQYDLKNRLPDGNCNIACNDSMHSCGGDRAFSLYIVSLQLPNYVGCFKSFGIGAHQLINNMTVEKCLRNCDLYNYAVLQSGNTCFCWNDKIKMSGRNNYYNKCTSKCTGALKTFCGAEDYVSVYETCNRVKYNLMKCSELFKCADEYNVFGECRRGCKSGYKGLHCLESDGTYEVILTTSILPTTKITTSNTTTRTMTTPSSTTKTTTTTSSTTKSKRPASSEIPSNTKEIQTRIYSKLTNFTDGLSTKSSDIYTSEIDLCLILNPCKDVSNSYCVMHEQKAICACTIGYSKNPNTDVCEDIDECEMKPCDSSSTTCTNLNGSYICDCNEGYVRATDEICLRDMKNILENPKYNLQGIEIEAMSKLALGIKLIFILVFFIMSIGAIGIIYLSCRRPPEDM